MLQRQNQRRCDLLIVSLLADIAILVFGAEGIRASDHVMQLRGGEELVVNKLDLCCDECVLECSHEGHTRSASITSEYDLCFRELVDLEVPTNLHIRFVEGLVRFRVGKGSGVSLPGLL